MGFSLVELLITIALFAIILTFSIPGFTALKLRNDRATAVNELTSHLNFARYTALQQGEEIIVCPSADASQCMPGRSWMSGWITWANRDRDTPPVRDEDEPLLRVAGTISAALSINANRNYFEFRPSGSAINGTWVICHSPDQIPVLAVILSITGRLRLSATMADGSTLTCTPN